MTAITSNFGKIVESEQSNELNTKVRNSNKFQAYYLLGCWIP